MVITEKKTGTIIEVIIEPVINSDYRIITKSKYFFNWKTEADYDVYKLRLIENKEILGLISLKNYPHEKRMEIHLLSVSKVNRGRNREYEGITGILIAFACREVLKNYGIEGCVSLIPKTKLKKHYMLKYGMEDAGQQLFLEGLSLLKMLTNYQV